MIIGIQDEILRINSLGLLDRLLVDKTTKSNILWATDAYNDLGSEYQRNKEIQAPLITGEHSGIIKNRARKALEQQFERTRRHAEVFTPLWVCSKMNDYADEEWFGKTEVFTEAGEPTDQVRFPKNKSWKRYVDSRRLEITCGEAPYLISRYDVSTGERIPIEQRIGILDRKLRVVNENTSTEDEWLKWTLRAFQASYGYEFQGDNVLISRVNLLTTFEEYLADRWKRKPTKKEYAAVTNIIAWNLWQMDGLTAALPYCKAEDEYKQISIFDWIGMNEDVDVTNTQSRCRIMNWLGGRSVEFINLPMRGNHGMKFDFIIGNPPYQEETQGTSDNPVYNSFMNAAYNISNKVLLITPARFLFNAGKTPKTWNEKMLADPHLKVEYYEQDSEKIFTNTEIKGGVAITYRDSLKDFGAIEHFIPDSVLRGITGKVREYHNFCGLTPLVRGTEYYKLSQQLHDENPTVIENMSSGHQFDLTSNILDKNAQLFFEQKPNDSQEYARVCGRQGGKRVLLYIKKSYLRPCEGLGKYKVILPESNNSGAFGETLVSPFVGEPDVVTTQTFISIGFFNTGAEAEALLKYICGKFARAMLGTLKITQHNKRETWANVPLQDFTPVSDIDWSKSISEIDQQLYVKYGLDESEIKFIESHVKEMK